MDTSDSDTDRIIRRALEEEAAGGSGIPGDPGLVGRVIETFRGRNRVLAFGAVVVNILLAVVAVIGLSRFLGTRDLREMLVWGGAALLAIGLILAVKVWYWMEMVRLDLTREVKRVEVQVARLAERVGRASAR